VKYFATVRALNRWRVRGTVAEVMDILGGAEDLPRSCPSVYIEVKKARRHRRALHQLMAAVHVALELPDDRESSGRFRHPFGDFVGRGESTLTQSGDDVDITYDRRIRAEKPLLKLFSPILKPIFGANHRWATSRGEESLKIELARRHGELPKATFR